MSSFKQYYYLDENLKSAIAAGALGLASIAGAPTAGADVKFSSPSATGRVPLRVSPSPTYNRNFIQEVKDAENLIKSGWRNNKFYPYPSPGWYRYDRLRP